MGDDFVRHGFPFIDLAAGGSIEDMIAALEEVVPKLPPDVKVVIPGHGNVSNFDDVRTYVKMLIDTRAVVEKAVHQGKTMDQLKQDEVLEPWKKWSGDFISSDAFIEALYNDSSGKKDGKFIKHN